MGTNEDRLFALLRQDIMDIDEEASQHGSVYSKDVAMINEESGSGFVARADGTLEFSASTGLGLKLDPETDTLIINATNILLMTDRIVQQNLPGNYLTPIREKILFAANEVKS